MTTTNNKQSFLTRRFLIWMDMEGISQIVNFKETIPVYSEYWKTGRAKFTSDAVAAALGLFRGGAKEVVVIDGHGLGWPNLLEEELPKNSRPFGPEDRFEDFDGLLMVGFHSRCGTPDGFMSHTFVPYLRMKINDALATEAHGWAMRAGIRVIGIIGDAALGNQVDGLIEGTPFLAAKKSTTRTLTSPAEPSSEASSKAISVFAAKCAQEISKRHIPKLSSPFTISFSMAPELAKQVNKAVGLLHTSPSVQTLHANNWGAEADPAIDAAIDNALRPTLQAMEGIDFSTEKKALAARTEKLDKARKYFSEWVNGNYASWED